MSVTAALLGALGAVLLYMFFRAVESRWPENYYGLSEIISYQISLNFGRYLSFRFLPVIVVGFVVSAAAISLDASGLATSLTTAVLHGGFTAGRASVNAVRHHGVFGRRLLLAAHIGVLAAVIGAGWLGGKLGYVEGLQALVPEPAEMRGNIWTALLAGIVGAYLVRATRSSEVNPVELARASARRVGSDLLRLAEDAAARHMADPVLVKAILLVENLQRPRWIRRLERGLGRVLRVGTYGVMQVHSVRPISDAESVELAVSTKLAGVRVPMAYVNGEPYPDIRRLREIIAAYNGSERFVDLVIEVYSAIPPARPQE